MVDEKRPPCDICRKSYTKKNKEPDCEACGLTYLLPENYVAMEIIEKYGSVIGNGYGGIDGASLNSVMDWYEIPVSDRGYLAQKIIEFFKALSNKETKRVANENN